MKKSSISQILTEWSDEFHNDYMNSYDKGQDGHYRDLLSEVIDRIDALNTAINRKWYKSE